MKIRCRTHAFTWITAFFVLMTVYGIFRISATAEEPGQRTSSGAKEKPATPRPDYQLFTLQFVKASEMSNLLTQILGVKPQGSSITLAADERTNSIIVSAPANELEQIKRLVKLVDREGANQQQRLSIFALRFIEPDKALEDALRLVFTGATGNFALDHQRKQVIVSTDDGTMKTVEALLARLDQPTESRPEEDLQVRVVWLVSGTVAQGTPEPPDDLKEMLPSLAKLGITYPRLAAQSMVNLMPGVKFRSRGIIKLDRSYRLDVTGRLRQSKQTPTLEMVIRVTPNVKDSSEEICTLETEIAAPPGHLVVLGVTPSEFATSAFVVKLVRKDSKNPGR